MWVWGSTRPGVTTLPERSRTMAAGGACAAGPIQAIFPFAMPIALSGTPPKGRTPPLGGRRRRRGADPGDLPVRDADRTIGHQPEGTIVGHGGDGGVGQKQVEHCATLARPCWPSTDAILLVAMIGSLAAFLAILVMVATASAQPLMGPDLAVTGITSTGTRVGIGETFTYTVTARNRGTAPCNWVNLTLQVPREVDFVTPPPRPRWRARRFPSLASSACPSTWPAEAGRGFSCGPGDTLTATFLVRARSTANDIRATAIADPGNVCFESNEANNKATTTSGTAIIRR